MYRYMSGKRITKKIKVIGMEYKEIYEIFKEKGYEIKFDNINHNGYIIKYDSEFLFINGVQFHIVYEHISLSQYDLKIYTRDDRLGYGVVVETKINLEDIDTLVIGTRWWDE